MNEKPEATILDVVPPLAVPMVTPWWVWLMAIALAALIVLAIVWLVRRKKPEIKISPKEKALGQLDSLRTRAANLDGHQFGVAVSDVMRAYLAEARGLRATQQTSPEFLADLQRQGIFQEKTQQRLREFLEACDFLKYTPVGRAAEPNRALLEQAHLFIREDAPL